ncbi:MAG: hypothetical protein HYZ28_26095 [Myxococcales bacterium]|nr:hypothetical protein [Myxococcales bacterium]
MVRIAFTVLLVVEAGGGGVPGPGWDGFSFRSHTDEVTGLRFDLPLTGVLFESRHFEPDPAGQMLEHALTLFGQEGPTVAVEVWTNPRRLELSRWFHEHQAFLLEKDTAVLSRSATRQKVEALVLEQPRTGQAFARKVAFFTLGQRVFRVTCVNRDDRNTLAAWERLLDTFEEAGRR